MGADQVGIIILTSAISSVVSAMVSCLFNRDTKTAVKEQGREIATLKDERVAKIESQLTEMKSGCSVRHTALDASLRELTAVMADLRNMAGWLKKVDLTVAELNRTLAAIQADVAARVEWIRNLNSAVGEMRGDLLRHVEDHEVHNG